MNVLCEQNTMYTTHTHTHTHCFLLVSSWLVSCQWISWSVHWSLPQVAIGSSQHLVDLPSVGSCDNEDKYHASLHPPLFSPSSLPLLLPSLCVCVCLSTSRWGRMSESWDSYSCTTSAHLHVSLYHKEIMVETGWFLCHWQSELGCMCVRTRGVWQL